MSSWLSALSENSESCWYKTRSAPPPGVWARPINCQGFIDTSRSCLEQREEESNLVAGYGASPAPFPQFLPRWARAEALDRPTGTTVAALDARRRVPRRPDVVQLDAGEIAGNDRRRGFLLQIGGSLDARPGRVRPRPSPPGGRKIAPTFTASGTVRPRGRTPSTRASVCR